MMSNEYCGPPSYVYKGEMTRHHHSCCGEVCVEGHEEAGVDYDLRRIECLGATCCCPWSSSITREHLRTNTDGRSYTERRRNPSSSVFISQNVYSYLYSFCLFFCIVLSKCSAQSSACDFKGSGLDLKSNGIQPVYLSCSSGIVDWHYPRAALRIVLQYPVEGRDFHGCIKASPVIEGARLFVEGHRSLVPLYSKDDGQPGERVRCFTSYKGRVALYVEAEPSPGFRNLKASFEYNLQPLPAGEVYNPLEECRPCSTSEMVQLYCSADFAAKGFIISADDDPYLQQTKVTLAASKIFQQTAPIFSKDLPADAVGKETKHSDWRESEDEMDNEIVASEDNRFLGHLFMPLECGARAGLGEFMVLGTMRFGQPVLRCAPRIEEWRSVVQQAQDRAHCVLQS